MGAESALSPGCGGTYGIIESAGFIEIQGDRREFVRASLIKKGMTVKG